MIETRDLQQQDELSRAAAEEVQGGTSPRLPGPAGKLKLAFDVGYAIGEAFDDATGFSDWVSGTDDHLIITKDVKNAGNPA